MASPFYRTMPGGIAAAAANPWTRQRGTPSTPARNAGDGLPAAAAEPATPGAQGANPAGKRAAQWPISKKIAPGQPGAKRWTERYGDALVCVRYRQDVAGARRLVTVELAVSDAPLRTRPRARDGDTLHVRIGRDEVELRSLVRDHGARWDWDSRTWLMPRIVARKLRLMDRVVTLVK